MKRIVRLSVLSVIAMTMALLTLACEDDLRTDPVANPLNPATDPTLMTTDSTDAVVDSVDVQLESHTILQLKVDPQRGVVEGVYIDTVYGAGSTCDSIPLMCEFEAPNDDGYVKLFYQPTGQLLFHGSIIWSGCGRVLYPSTYMNPETLAHTTAVPYPGENRFKYEMAQYPMEEQYSRQLWDIIGDLSLVAQYASSNRKISVLRYFPSVGIGDPNDMRLIVFME